MRLRFLGSVVLLVVLAAPAAADDYKLDPAHTAVTFKISHLGLSWTHGRFNGVSGDFTLDPGDASKCSFNVAIKADSVDTANAQRDEHLRGPDFFNVKQFPGIAFKSTSVTAMKDGYQVTGDLTLHGVTRSVSFPLAGGRKAEFPRGIERTGYSGELTLKRSEFGMDKMTEAIGDEVVIAMSFEGTRKK